MTLNWLGRTRFDHTLTPLSGLEQGDARMHCLPESGWCGGLAGAVHPPGAPPARLESDFGKTNLDIANSAEFKGGVGSRENRSSWVEKPCYATYVGLWSTR